MARIPLRSRPVAATIVLLAAAAVLISAAAAYRLLRVSRDLTAGKNALVRVEPRLRAEDLAGARRLMTVAHNRTLRAGVRLHNSPELSLINLIPVAHQNLRAIRQSVDLGLKMVDAGSRPPDAATPLADARGRIEVPMRAGSIPVKTITALRDQVEDLSAGLPVEDDRPSGLLLFPPVKHLQTAV